MTAKEIPLRVLCQFSSNVLTGISIYFSDPRLCYLRNSVNPRLNKQNLPTIIPLAELEPQIPDVEPSIITGQRAICTAFEGRNIIRRPKEAVIRMANSVLSTFNWPLSLSRYPNIGSQFPNFNLTPRSLLKYRHLEKRTLDEWKSEIRNRYIFHNIFIRCRSSIAIDTFFLVVSWLVRAPCKLIQFDCDRSSMISPTTSFLLDTIIEGTHNISPPLAIQQKRSPFRSL
jgi:hypothetical protein